MSKFIFNGKVYNNQWNTSIDLDGVINGLLLWENPDMTVEFSNKTIKLKEEATKCDYFELLWVMSNQNNNRYYTTGKLEKLYTNLRLPYNDGVHSRNTSQSTAKTEVSFGRSVLYSYTGGGTSVEDETWIIPYQIIGYKKADFDPINGILPPADKVTFDNSKSGLVSTDVQNAMDEAMMMFDKYRALDYSNQHEVLLDALLIDVNNPNADINVTKWRVNKNAGTINMPLECVAGIREFYYFSDQYMLVKLTEVDPIVGRVWYIKYNKDIGLWDSWVKYGDINDVSVTPNPGVATSIVAKRMGNLISLNILTSWQQWNNSTTGNILLAWIGMEPIVYVSREVIFMGGTGEVIGIGNIVISNTNIQVQTPIDWVNGTYAHISATIAFLIA